MKTCNNNWNMISYLGCVCHQLYVKIYANNVNNVNITIWKFVLLWGDIAISFHYNLNLLLVLLILPLKSRNITFVFISFSFFILVFDVIVWFSLYFFDNFSLLWEFLTYMYWIWPWTRTEQGLLSVSLNRHFKESNDCSTLKYILCNILKKTNLFARIFWM